MSIFQQDRTFQQPLNWTTTFFHARFPCGRGSGTVHVQLEKLSHCGLSVVAHGKHGNRHVLSPLADPPRIQNDNMARVLDGDLRNDGARGADLLPGWPPTESIIRNTDKEGDPHSPNDGGLWAHMGWIITGKAMHQKHG